LATSLDLLGLESSSSEPQTSSAFEGDLLGGLNGSQTNNEKDTGEENQETANLLGL